MIRTYSCASVLFLMALSGSIPAHASWDITKKERPANKSYCAVSKYFDQTIITIGRNVAGQSSMALEFPDKRFDEKKQYTVAIKPGAEARFEVEVKPQSPRVLVINLDQVVDLTRALDNMPVLQTKIEGQNLTFALAGWDEASQDVRKCLASFGATQDAPAVTAQMTPVKPVTRMPVVVPAPEAKTMAAKPMAPLVPEPTGDIAVLQRQIRLLQDTNNKLQDQVRGQSVAGGINTPAPIAPQKTPDDRADLQRQIDQLIKDNTDLRAQSGVRAATVTPALLDDVTVVPQKPTAITPIPAVVTLGQLAIMPDMAVKPAKRNPFGSGAAYMWDEGDLVGLMVQQDGPVADLGTAAQKMIDRLKKSCKGQVAAQPAGVGTLGDINYVTYDVACMQGDNSTTAAVLFYTRNRRDLVVVSYEAAPEAMPQGMAARDRVIAGLR